MSLVPSWLAQAPTPEELQEQITLDSLILTEQFYFFTVVVMWLIHAGFMAYEAGAARRKNVMSTAMKNILTIAVVTPTFYYFGWYIYGCFEEGWPKDGHDSPTVEGLDILIGFCQNTAPWAAQMGPNLGDHVSGVFFLAFLLFSWTTASIMSGALIERVRLSAFLILAAVLGSGVWIMDAAWGWSSGGWLVTRFGFHDSIASLVVHGVAGAFALGVLLNLGPRIGKYTTDGLARSFRGHNTHLTLMGLMLIFTGFYGFYAACLVITSTAQPGWLNIYGSPTTLGAIAFVITVGFAGGFTGGWFASKGDPFWTLSGGLAGVISVSAGRGRLPPVARVPALHLRRRWSRSGPGTTSRRSCASTMRSGRWRSTGCAASTASSSSGSSPAATRPGSTRSSRRWAGSSWACWRSSRSPSCRGTSSSWILKKLNLLRVPPEVELEGLDLAEFGQDFYPEFERVPEVVDRARRARGGGRAGPARLVLADERQTPGPRRHG